ncbi:MAG: hypothetical protein U0990_04620 [Candidatus Nanopelagicales bacterium]|nr:hypothetical protein [Candidatus Nanopelagicales bacterium]MDZ4249356.1 hypothetical protein [Candidatus Nanopelagicales bacterium]MDZ7576693.1 hypothetical protein [Candidatus Nanopelagicales bacterium]
MTQPDGDQEEDFYDDYDDAARPRAGLRTRFVWAAAVFVAGYVLTQVSQALSRLAQNWWFGATPSSSSGESGFTFETFTPPLWAMNGALVAEALGVILMAAGLVWAVVIALGWARDADAAH